MTARLLAKLIFNAWKAEKLARGITVHITDHSKPAQNLLKLNDFCEMNEEDQGFDIAVAARLMNEVDVTF